MEWKKSGISIARLCKLKCLHVTISALLGYQSGNSQLVLCLWAALPIDVSVVEPLVISFLYTFIELVVSHCSFTALNTDGQVLLTFLCVSLLLP